MTGGKLLAEPDGSLLYEALTGAIADLAGGERLVVVEVTGEGATTFEVRRDGLGVPRCRWWPPVRWAGLLAGAADDEPALSASALFDAVRLDESVVADTEMIIICVLPEGRYQAQAVKLLHEVVGSECRVLTRSVDGTTVTGVLRSAISQERLTHWYELIVLRQDRTGGLKLGGQPLFTVGAQRGDTVPVTVRCARSGRHGTVFAITAWARSGDYRLLSARSAKLPPGEYKLVAELLGPGQVRFRGLPTGITLTSERRSWEEIVRSIPERLDLTIQPPHLVCAVEFSGPREKVAERLRRVQQVIAVLAEEFDDTATISLIAYGPHSFHRRSSDRRSKNAPVRLVTDGVTGSRALNVLEELERGDIPGTGYPYAAQLECALAKVLRLTSGASQGRTVLLIVGDRPPHPPRVDISEIVPCPERHDWRRILDEFDERGIGYGAICDRPFEQLEPVWLRLGGPRGPACAEEVVDPRRLAVDLRLLSDIPQLVPLPLEVP